MGQDQFGGKVYRMYERERLRKMARKLGLRLLKFRDGRLMAGKDESPRKEPDRVTVIEGRKRVAE